MGRPTLVQPLRSRDLLTGRIGPGRRHQSRTQYEIAAERRADLYRRKVKLPTRSRCVADPELIELAQRAARKGITERAAVKWIYDELGKSLNTETRAWWANNRHNMRRRLAILGFLKIKARRIDDR